MDNQKTLLEYLPKRLAGCVEYYQNAGYAVEEIRLHRGEPLLLVCGGDNLFTGTTCTDADFEATLFSLCEGSMYAHADTIRNGYISLKNGHRVGVCGEAVTEGETLRSVKNLHTLCLRWSHNVTGNSLPLYHRLTQNGFLDSVLIYSAPGVGKTTLLRDLTRRLASGSHPLRVSVVDSRRELATDGLTQGTSIDLLRGYPKAKGMEIALRTLSPQYLICDEIGSEEDARALLQIMHAGVRVVATVHGSDLHRLLKRPWVQMLHEQQVFNLYCGILRTPGGRRLQIDERDTL